MTFNYLKLKKNLLRILLHLFLTILGIFFVIPFVWMIISSFKRTPELISLDFHFLPIRWVVENYQQIFGELSIGRAYINSIIVGLSVTLLVIITSALAGYLFAKLKFRGKELLFIVVLISMMIPPQIGILALYFLASKVGILNSYQGLIAPFMMSAFSIFLVRQFINGIPDSLLESAKIDGASDFGIFSRIIVPLITPILSVVGILTFAWNWDMLLWPLVVVNTMDMKTLPLMFVRYVGIAGDYYGPAMAAATLMIIPLIIIYLIFQKNLIKGMALTGLKE